MEQGEQRPRPELPLEPNPDVERDHHHRCKQRDLRVPSELIRNLAADTVDAIDAQIGVSLFNISFMMWMTVPR